MIQLERKQNNSKNDNNNMIKNIMMKNKAITKLKNIIKKPFIINRNIISSVFFFSLISVTSPMANDFVIADIPAMETMAIGEKLEMDSFNGRIVQIPTSVSANKSTIIKYYRSVLPNFGWKPKSLTKYIRDDEVLIINISKPENDGTTVEFTITTP